MDDHEIARRLFAINNALGHLYNAEECIHGHMGWQRWKRDLMKLEEKMERIRDTYRKHLAKEKV